MQEEALIVGLSEVGASIGLALGARAPGVLRTGYDADSGKARQARKAGAVERLGLNLEKAARTADQVILTVASGEVRPYLELIGPQLKPEALVVDTSSLKSAASQWASELLPPGRHYIGAIPVVNPSLLHIGAPGQGEPRAGLFDGGLMGMIVPARTPGPAVDRALALAETLGAKPFFLDAAEVDGVTATIEDLPALLATALIRVAMQAPGWREAQRMAGRLFATSAVVGALQSPKTLQASLALNRANVVARLDAAIEELRALRSLISADRTEELTTCLQEAAAGHAHWYGNRLRADWSGEDLPKVELPEGSLLDRLIGIGGNLRPKDRR